MTNAAQKNLHWEGLRVGDSGLCHCVVQASIVRPTTNNAQVIINPRVSIQRKNLGHTSPIIININRKTITAQPPPVLGSQIVLV